jgi:hypothetical protein
MTQHNRLIAFTVGVLFSGLATQTAFADTANPSLSFTTRTAGFLTPSNRRAPGPVDGASGHLVDRLCALASRSAGRNCPGILYGDLGFPSGPDDITAGLKHLRLNIIVRRMENIVVAGEGVGVPEDAWASFKITSSAADVALPGPADPPSNLPAPPPGPAWTEFFHTWYLFQGIILNGCVGVPASFDLTLDSSVYRLSDGAVFGSVHLVDEVDGHGYYNFKYTIRATDDLGNKSDFVFSGDADSYCTSKATL